MRSFAYFYRGEFLQRRKVTLTLTNSAPIDPTSEHVILCRQAITHINGLSWNPIFDDRGNVMWKTIAPLQLLSPFKVDILILSCAKSCPLNIQCKSFTLFITKLKGVERTPIQLAGISVNICFDEFKATHYHCHKNVCRCFVLCTNQVDSHTKRTIH